MDGRVDLGVMYARNMEHFGCGVAMFHPVSAADMRPPCVGYLDSNRRWNHLTNIEWHGDDLPPAGVYEPLEKVPQKMAELNIEWRPRTTLGVRQSTVDAQGQTPDNLPVGADAKIRYSSKTRFGAILIAQKPVTLTSYNDETLFRHWIVQNRNKLAELHGVELSRHGLWLVTRTYTTPQASINAWLDRDKDASMSLKVKASMMGDLAGADIDWSEKGSDKDWTHFSGNQGVVAFFDGISVPAWQWWYDGVKARVGKRVGLIRSQMTPNKAGLGPHGTWRPVKRAGDPRRQSAPGADDAWIEASPITPIGLKGKVEINEPARVQVTQIVDPGGDDVVMPETTIQPKITRNGQDGAQDEDDDDQQMQADLWGSSPSPLRDVSPFSQRRTSASLSRRRPHSLASNISPSRSVSLLSQRSSPRQMPAYSTPATTHIDAFEDSPHQQPASSSSKRQQAAPIPPRPKDPTHNSSPAVRLSTASTVTNTQPNNQDKHSHEYVNGHDKDPFLTALQTPGLAVEHGSERVKRPATATHELKKKGGSGELRGSGYF